MKKTLIILGIIILIIVGAVWTYLFIFGVPKDAGEVFGRFQGDSGTPVFTGNDPGSTIDVAPVTDMGALQRLRQLTTRPVAGAMAFYDTIRYVERGTGHVYDIDMQSGEEFIVSGTTLPKTVDATFSSNGEAVALTTITNGVTGVVVGLIPEDEAGGGFDGETLPQGAKEVAFANAINTVNYYLPSATGGTAYSYHLVTKKSTELFITPLTDVRIVWGRNTYIYTTPTAEQQGYAYRLQGGALTYLAEGETGLSLIPYTNGMILTKTTEGGLSSENLTRDTEIPILGLLPEKCIASQVDANTLYCAATTQFEGTKKYPDDWYKGVVSFSDLLFKIHAASSSVEAFSDPKEESGRSIDVASIGIHPEDDFLYFINKNDNTLWMYDLRNELE